jgi:tetratricopeptide (TPR) repeat protein
MAGFGGEESWRDFRATMQQPVRTKVHEDLAAKRDFRHGSLRSLKSRLDTSKATICSNSRHIINPRSTMIGKAQQIDKIGRSGRELRVRNRTDPWKDPDGPAPMRRATDGPLVTFKASTVKVIKPPTGPGVTGCTLKGESVVAALEKRKHCMESDSPLYAGELDGGLPSDHLMVANALQEEAGLAYERGELVVAEELLTESMRMHEWTFGRSHRIIGYLVDQLAEIHYKQGNFETALPLFERAVELCKTLAGPAHPKTAKAMNNLAVIYHQLQRPSESEGLLRQALEIREDIVAKEIVDVGAAMLEVSGILNNLGIALTAMGRLKDATYHMERALTIHEELLGTEHQITQTSLTNLAAVHRGRGKYKQADKIIDSCQYLNLKTRYSTSSGMGML